jgi:hypothetical protein
VPVARFTRAARESRGQELDPELVGDATTDGHPCLCTGQHQATTTVLKNPDIAADPQPKAKQLVDQATSAADFCDTGHGPGGQGGNGGERWVGSVHLWVTDC